MNGGAFGENFPYSNFHDLNMDWVIKTVKDFLDQYTHLQNVITEGEETVNTAATEGVEQIQNQLTETIEEFSEAADAKAAQTIASIPEDYTDLFNKALKSSGIIISPQNVSEYPTLDNLPLNSIFLVLPTAASSVAGSPFGTDGYSIITTGQSSNPAYAPYGGEIQIAIPFNSTSHTVKTRSHNGDNWTSWSMDISHCIRSLDTIVSTTAQYTDVHDFPNNSIMLVINAGLAIQNKPYPYQNFIVVTLGQSGQSTPYAGKTQVAIPYNSSADHSIRYCSYNGTAWTAWSTDYQVDATISYGYITGDTYTDIDNLPINSFMGFASQEIAHRPFNDPFLIYTIGISGRKMPTVPYGGELQVAFPFYTTAGEPRYRVYDGSAWSTWYPNRCELHLTPANFIDEIISHQDIYDELIVHLRLGTYEMFDSTHNEAFWKAHRKATRYMGFCLKNTTIIADSLVQINARYTGSDTDILENFSVFNIIDNVHLENLFVTAQNICYIVHDDTPIVSVSSSNASMKNCILTHSGSTHTFENGAPICYGAGMAGGTMRTIENCIFRNPQRTFAVSFHSSTASNGLVVITNCVFEGTTLRLAPMGTGGTGTILFTNNYIASDIINLSSPFIVRAYNNPT